MQDRDGAGPLLWNLREAFPSVRLTSADRGSPAARHLGEEKLKPRLTLHVVKRGEPQFVVLPRRWVVGRTFSWIAGHGARSAAPSDSPDVARRWSTGDGPPHDPPPRKI